MQFTALEHEPGFAVAYFDANPLRANRDVLALQEVQRSAGPAELFAAGDRAWIGSEGQQLGFAFTEVSGCLGIDINECAEQAAIDDARRAGQNVPGIKSFPVKYVEGAAVGYRWYAQEKRQPLYPFGYGLSYTSFAYKNLKVEDATELKVSFDVTNTGPKAGADVPQVYLTARSARPNCACWAGRGLSWRLARPSESLSPPTAACWPIST